MSTLPPLEKFLRAPMQGILCFFKITSNKFIAAIRAPIKFRKFAIHLDLCKLNFKIPMLTKRKICSVQSFLTRKTLYETVAVTLAVFFFVYVNLRCIAKNQKKISKMSTLPPPPEKNSADAHACSQDTMRYSCTCIKFFITDALFR